MRSALAGQRLAVMAIGLYLGLGTVVATPPDSRLVLLVVPGVGLLVSGIRTNRPVLVGAALALASGGWTLRLALATAPPGAGVGWGRSISALLLGLGLLAVAELARLAVDAGPRRGPVRVEAALRRRTLRQDAAVGGLGLLASALVLVLAGPGGRAPVPSVFLPLGVLAVAGVAGVVVALIAVNRSATVNRSVAARRRQRTVRSGTPRRRVRILTGLVVLGALALPALAALGARAPLPPAPSGGGAGGPGTAASADSGAGADAGTAPPRPDATVEADPARPWVALGLLAVLAGVALLFVGGERLVSADDLRPDVAPPDDLLVGAPSAPDVRALPPEEVAAILEDALGYLRGDLEPRLAVRCAYAAVAGGLGRHDLARRPAETELEFLGRQLTLLTDRAGVGKSGAGGPGGGRPVDGQAILARRRALTRLTGLFEVARFSNEPIDEVMRAEALAAVEALLADGPGTIDAGRPSGAGRGQPGSSPSPSTRSLR